VLNEGLPSNVNLLTLDRQSDSYYLLRLEHIYDEEIDDELATPVTINLNKVFFSYLAVSLEYQIVSKLQAFFNGFSIKYALETLLNGIQFKKDSTRLVWKETIKVTQTNISSYCTDVVDIENVVLHPMQIRTFIIRIETNP